MHPDFTEIRQGRFTLLTALPASAKMKVLRGGQIVAASGPEGNMTWQSIEEPHFSIHFSLFDFARSVRIPFIQKAAPLISLFALKNNITYKIKGLGLVHLQQGQFALLHSGTEKAMAHFRRPGTMQVLEISWSQETIQQAMPYFTVLEKLLHPSAGNRSFFVGDSTIYQANAKVLTTAHEIINCPYNDSVSKLFFEHKVREYLLLLLIQVGNQPAKGMQLSAEEWEKIDDVARLLRSVADQRYPIAKLARQAQMNTMKLKMAFSQKYGQGIFEYHLHHRMKEAMRLLQETNLSLKVISSLVGYELATSFITKFREHFGFPPGAITRKKGK